MNRVSKEPPSGSSPLTRGKLEIIPHVRIVIGLIPAHAGKTPKSGRPPSWRTAHPRSRGENVSGTLWPGLQDGSSPLTRGKRLTVAVRTARGRLIPAHAGKTPRGRTARYQGPAHPRSRGENWPLRVMIVGTVGSSPLTRGKPLGSFIRDDADRLIPAHAGKTYQVSAD